MSGIHQFTSSQWVQSGSTAVFKTGINANIKSPITLIFCALLVRNHFKIEAGYEINRKIMIIFFKFIIELSLYFSKS